MDKDLYVKNFEYLGDNCWAAEIYVRGQYCKTVEFSAPDVDDYDDLDKDEQERGFFIESPSDFHADEARDAYFWFEENFNG